MLTIIDLYLESNHYYKFIEGNMMFIINKYWNLYSMIKWVDKKEI